MKTESGILYPMLPFLGIVLLGGIGILKIMGVVKLAGEVPMLLVSGNLCLIISGLIGLKYKQNECLGFGLAWGIAVLAIPQYIGILPIEPSFLQNSAVVIGTLTMLRLAKIAEMSDE